MARMNWLLWIVFGAVAGWIASLVVGKAGSQGPLMNIVVGIVGALLGGWLFNQFGAGGVTGFNLPSLLVAVVGAIVLLLLVRLFSRGA
jgi:uncharacterized membrane protein YeaQ/YmgE (transglycosylase-associated protein family)